MALGKGRKTVLISFIGCASVFLAFSPMLKVLLVEEWRLYKLSSPDPSERRSAAAALGDSGSLRAMPRLLELLRGTIKLEESTRFDIDRGTLGAWPWIRDRELQRIPLCFCNPQGQLWAALDPTILKALGQIAEKRGRGAAAVLVEMLETESPDSELLPVIVSLLGRLGPEADAALPTLEKLRAASKNSNPSLWHLAVDALWEIRDSPLFSPTGK
jgi:hypothetical protein